MKVLKKILSGEFLATEFVIKNRVYITLLLGLIFFNILTSSYGDLRAGKKESLNNEIANLKEKSVTYEALLMQQSLQSSVLEQINKRNIGLIKQKEPIKIIIITND